MASFKPIRVLHLISSSGVLGAERVILELATQSELTEFKIAIGVFENSKNPNLELAQVAKELGLEVQVFPCNARWDKNTIRTIKGYLDRANIQILHSHNYKSNFYAWRALSSKNVRWVVTNHGRRFGPKLFIYNLLDAFIVRSADKVIAVSEQIATKMKLAGIGDEKICLIENGVNLDRFSRNTASNSIKESLGIKKQALVIGAVGSLTKEKGHSYLLKAVPKVVQGFPEAIFLLVGDGEERPSLEKMVSKLGIKDKIIFAGARKDVPQLLPMLDVFVLPSLNEGLPMALLEAQAARIPVIATRVGAIPKVVKDGVTGALMPPKDPGAIAKAVIQILFDKKVAAAMAEKGFERILNNFSCKKMASKYLSLYKELLS